MVKYLTTTTLGVFFVLIFAMAASNAIAEGGSGCEGDIKIEDAPHTYVAGPEEEVVSVCIKAGEDIFEFYCTDAASSSEVYVKTDGCYTVTFYAKCTDAIITGGGTDRSGKDISHSAVVFGARPASEPESNYEDNGSDDTDDVG